MRPALLVACWLSCSFAAEARAQAAAHKTSSLSWARLDGAETCTGTVEIAKRVEAVLGRSAIVPASTAELSIEGRVERTLDGRFRATIVLAKSSGEILGRRELETHGEVCAELDEPASLAVALMIDPDALSRAPKPADPPPDVVPPPSQPLPPPPALLPEETPLRFEGYLGGYAALGLAPIGGGLIAGVVFDPKFLGAFEGNVTLAESTLNASETARVEFWHFEASAYYCPLAGHVGLFQGALCAGGQAGFMATSGSGFLEDVERVRPLLNGAARGRIGVWPFPFSFTAGATLSVPIVRDAYLYRRGGEELELFAAAPVQGAFDLSVGFKFPEDKPAPKSEPGPAPALGTSSPPP